MSNVPAKYNEEIDVVGLLTIWDKWIVLVVMTLSLLTVIAFEI